MKERLDSFYCGAIGGVGGLITWFHEVGIDITFVGSLIKAAIIAIVSTLLGLIVKQIWYKLFPYKNK